MHPLNHVGNDGGCGLVVSSRREVCERVARAQALEEERPIFEFVDVDHASAVKGAHNGARVPFVAGRLDDLEDHSACSAPSDTNHRALGFERAFDRDVPRSGPGAQSVLRRLERHLVMVVECSARPQAVGARDGRSRPRA